MTVYTGSAPSAMYADFLIDLNVRSQDERANTSTINYRIYLKSKSGGYPFSSSQHKLDFTADRKTIVNTTTTYKVPANGEYTLASGTFVIAHNSDGTKSFGFSSGFASYHGSCTVSGTMTLPAIQRGAKLIVTDNYKTPISSAKIGDSIGFTIEKPNVSGNQYKVSVTIPTNSGSVTQFISFANTENWISYQIPRDWIRSYFSDSMQKMITFELMVITSNGNSFFDRKTIPVRVPSGYEPEVSSLTATTRNTTGQLFLDGRFVQHLTGFALKAYANGKEGASIESYRFEMNGNSWSSSIGTLNAPSVSKSGPVTITVTVTDSRGQSSSKSTIATVEPYNLPTIDGLTVERSNSTVGNATVRASHTVFSSESGDDNAATIKVRIRKAGTSVWEEVFNATDPTSSFSRQILLGESLDQSLGYDVEATITDKFHSNTARATLPASDITFVLDTYNNNVGIGKFPDISGRDGLDVKGKIYSEGKPVATGDISEFLKADTKLFLKNIQRLTSSDNLNNVFEAGFYSVRSASNTPTGAGRYGSLIVSRADSTTIGGTTDSVQIYADSENKMFIRNSIDMTNAWTVWKEVGSSGSEINFYSDGYKVKHPNGLIEQVVFSDLTSTERNFTSGSTGFYGAKTKVVYFHESFKTVYCAIANCWSPGYVQGFVGETYSNRANVRLYSPNSVSASALSGAKVVLYVAGT